MGLGRHLDVPFGDPSMSTSTAMWSLNHDASVCSAFGGAIVTEGDSAAYIKWGDMISLSPFDEDFRHPCSYSGVDVCRTHAATSSCK